MVAADFFQFKTVMGTVVHTAAAMDTYINSSGIVLGNCIDGAGCNTFTAGDAEFFLYNNATAFPI